MIDQGDYHHNLEVLRTGGTLVPRTRPGSVVVANYRNYLPSDHLLSLTSDLLKVSNYLKELIPALTKELSENKKKKKLEDHWQRQWA